MGILAISLIVILLDFYKGYEDTSKVRTEVSFTTDEFLYQMNQSTQENLEPYIEKAIEIHGIIDKITFKKGKYSLFLKGDNSRTLILCELQNNQNQKINSLKIGDMVAVKGILKGFLMDAILLNCIILENEKHE